MATILLSAAGAAIGGMASGTVLGLTGAVIGRAVGATLGRVIDQRLLGGGSEPVERGRIERFRLTQAGEGGPVAQLFGRMRIGGQVIWATRFVEKAATSGGGKGAPPQPRTTTYSYCLSLAVALCEGEIRRVGRVWADGVELDLTTVTMRVYAGGEDQMPDPLMEAVEGAGQVPAYRGIAYVVFEDLDLTPFGNRVPQFAFEVVRAAPPVGGLLPAAADLVQAVALMPGTGEYVLATGPVTYRAGLFGAGALNTSTAGGGADFPRALAQARGALPHLKSVSLIYSWFGDDLRAGACRVKPKIEDRSRDGAEMPWTAGGIDRGGAEELARVDGRPVYGGTPADASVIDAIRAIREGGQEVMLYPFLLMEILPGNGRPTPWAASGEQPAFPWRGRITGEKAPGVPGSPDGTAANDAAVAAFFGSVTAADFAVAPGAVSYHGPAEWSYTRFILHAAALAAAAGGVEAFCIGSEMRGLTQMRGAGGFPAVARLRQLAAQVRLLLPEAKLTYAADWSEYFGYHPQDGSGDVLFHLDPLWADPEIDFIGIDNYMPLSDWRDGLDHADAGWGEIHALDYLKANIEGGEGFDWFYPTEEARAAQRREPITDGLLGKPWVFRYKDIASWWGQPHYDRVAGVEGDILQANGALAGLFAGPMAVVTDGAGTNDAGRPATRIVQTGAGSHVTAEVTLAADETYTLRFLVKSATGQPQVSAASVSEGVAQALVYVADGAWQEVRLAFRTAGTEVELSLSDLRGGGDGTDLLVSEVALISARATTPWVPRSKPIRFTEIGCAAVDKGTNQPNLFNDPKSSESALPRHSNGRRDDLIQAQYLRAILSYWAEPGRNPVSEVYGGPMLEMDRAHVWAWDARPWPAFPNDVARWADGGNWARGHWITGRIEAVPLDHVVAALCEAAGVTAYDVSRLYGLVRGHLSGETESARARLQALMLAYGFQAVERDGLLVFLPLPRRAEAVIDPGWTAREDDGPGGLAETRAAGAETAGRVRVGHVAAETAYEDRVAEAVFPGDGADAVTGSDLPLALTGPEGQAVAERWLAEARVARDQLRFALPPSRRGIGAGALVALADGSTWRIDRVEDRGVRAIEAVRAEPSVFTPSDAVEERVLTAEFVPPVPVSPVFLDLPLITGAEVEHSPHLAVTATPWPGSVAVYAAAGSDGFTLDRLVERRAVIGQLVTPLGAAMPGAWDRGGPVRVRIAAGALSGAEAGAVLNGANLAAIGSGDDGDWEVIQFAGATLVAAGEWEIGLRLRGQLGTDGVMPAVWPEGSLFVLLDGAPGQIALPAAARGLARTYRIGPARRSVDDASYVERLLAFRGVGLRPYAPAHLRAVPAGGDLLVSWVRRTRIDGDSWEGLDVPLGEAGESYLLRVIDAGGLRREVIGAAPAFAYTAAMRAADGLAPPFSIEVAQLSDRFGPGPFARIEIDD